MKSQPHIILLMADQLRIDCLGAYGSLPVATPNLDELAKQSVVMEYAYCATPLCGPTRTSMYTGKHAHQHGAIVNQPSAHNRAGADHKTLYESLDAGGYGITHVGVQHCRTRPSLEERVPNALIEDERAWQAACPVESDRSHTLPYVPYKVGHDAEGRAVIGEYAPPRRILNPHPLDKFRDVWWADRIEGYIQDMDFDSPQYIEASFWAPHVPLDLPEPYYSMYPPDAIELTETVGRWYPGQPDVLLDRICGQIGRSALRDEYRQVWSAYYGLVTMVDECIGRVIRALKAKGIWESSVVLFTTDHGEMLGEHHLFGKSCFYESACRIPVFIKSPDSQPSRRSDLVSAIDYCATVCDYAGVIPPNGQRGLSLKPLVEDHQSTQRDAIFMEYNGDLCGPDAVSRSIVAWVDGERWKYVYNQDHIDELYNLSEDPNETRSLTNSESIPELCIYRESMKDIPPVTADECAACRPLRDQLRQQLFDWMRETGDAGSLPLTSA